MPVPPFSFFIQRQIVRISGVLCFDSAIWFYYFCSYYLLSVTTCLSIRNNFFVMKQCVLDKAYKTLFFGFRIADPFGGPERGPGSPQARLDSLTGILNRQQFFEKGEQLLKTMEPAGKQQSRCFIILDLDSFKEINDRYGHPAGDRVLRETADRLLYEAKKNGKNQFVMEEA